jgi:hypothetical protein
MKWKLEFSGEYPDDMDLLKSLSNFHQMELAIFEAKDIIRSRIKWGEGVPQDEVNILERIQSALYIEGIE